jgi:spore germination cell wall hydrolase CwlJ-like protein
MNLLKVLLLTILSLFITTSVYARPVTNEEFEDIILLAKVISGESGADWCTDEMRYGVGSVVANRVQSDEFPDTYEKVIYQSGQYGCTDTKYFKQFPSEHCIAIAADIIINGNEYPEDVLYQSNEPLGHGVYKHIQNMYFCYV